MSPKINRDFLGPIDWNDKTNIGIMADDEDSEGCDNQWDLDEDGAA